MTYTPGRIIRRVGRPPTTLSAWALVPLVQPKRADEVYTAAIVVAGTEFEAQHLHPDCELRWSATMDSWPTLTGSAGTTGRGPTPRTCRPPGSATLLRTQRLARSSATTSSKVEP